MGDKTLNERVRYLEDELVETKNRLRLLEAQMDTIYLPCVEDGNVVVPERRGVGRPKRGSL